MIRKFATNSALVFVDQAIFSGSNFLLTFLLARQLSLVDFGYYSSVVVATYLVLSVGSAMITQPFQIIISKKNANDVKEYYCVLLAALILFIVVFVFFVYTICKLPVFFKYQHSFYQEHLSEILFFVAAYVFQDFFRKIALATEKIRWVLLIDLLFLAVFPTILFQKNIGGSSVLSTIGLINIISTIPFLVVYLKNTKITKNMFSQLNYHFTEGKWLVSAAVIQWFSGNFFVMVSGLYLGVEALGALRLVQSFFGVLNILLQTVENYYLPKTAQLYHINPTKAKNFIFKIASKGAILFAIVLLIFFVFSTPLILIIGGEKYSNYGGLVKLVSVLYVFIFLGYPVRIAIRILELNKVFFSGYAISMVVSLLSFHLLMKYIGLYGAVIGLIINQLTVIFFWKSQLIKNNFLIWK